jgi:hypothetical protein
MPSHPDLKRINPLRRAGFTAVRSLPLIAPPASPIRGFASRMHHHRIWVSGVFAHREVGSTVIGSSQPSIVATVVAQGLKLPPNYSAADCVQQNVSSATPFPDRIRGIQADRGAAR